jgi:hypothetical protein
MIEAVRDQTKAIDLKQVNAVMLQPHWPHAGDPQVAALADVVPRALSVRNDRMFQKWRSCLEENAD